MTYRVRFGYRVRVNKDQFLEAGEVVRDKKLIESFPQFIEEIQEEKKAEAPKKEQKTEAPKEGSSNEPSEQPAVTGDAGQDAQSAKRPVNAGKRPEGK